MTPSHRIASSTRARVTSRRPHRHIKMCDKNMQLVKAIEKFPCLYNYNLPEYLKKDISDKAWHDVASQTQLSVSECKEKWKNLRYGLLRSLRLNPDGSGKRKYYLHDEMGFIIPYIRSSKQHEFVFPQMDVETDEENNVYDQENETSLQVKYHHENPEQPKKKVRTSDNCVKYLQQKADNNEVNDDSRKMFLLSILPEVNALSECQMRVFRRKILLLLDEIVDSPSQYEMCLLQWQKGSLIQEAEKSSEHDSIKKEQI